MFYGTSCVIIKSCVSPRVIMMSCVRYLDITLGLLLLISMLSLLYGSYSLHPILLVIFFTLSLTVLVAYWIWYLYTNFIASHYPMFEEQVGAHLQNNWHQLSTLHPLFMQNLKFLQSLTMSLNVVVSDWEDRLFPDSNVLGPLDTNCCPLPRHSNCSLSSTATQPLSARSYDNLLDSIRDTKIHVLFT